MRLVYLYDVNKFQIKQQQQLVQTCQSAGHVGGGGDGPELAP